jgi:NhaP-type Na+/H+ or K+/H+ antiporter
MGLHLRQRAQELARTVATTRGRPSRSSSRRDATESEHERANRIVRERKLNYDRLSFCVMACAMWAMLRFAFGEVMAPNGANVEVSGGGVWAVALIWACAHVGGAAAVMCGLPSLTGMLLCGLLLRNVPGGLVNDLPERWSSDIRAAGLSVILMRSGLELDLDAFRSIGWMASRLTVMPGLSEAIACGLFSMLIFKMSFPLGMCLGFILGAVSPAVVVLGMFELQSLGYGVAKGIPSLVVAAASFDDVVAITGYTIFKSFALGSKGHMAWTILHGPVDVLAGLCVGTLGGVICGMTKIWNERWKRSSMVMILGLFTMFLGRHYGFNGGGAMSALALGISANKCWRTNKPHPALTNGPSDDHAHGVETDLAKLWRFIFQPLLFGVIGTAVSFKDVTPSTIPKSIGLLLIGICIRLPMAYVAVGGGELSRIERAFVSLAWIPKATVQAALASDPLDYIIEKKKSAEYVSWGNDILTTAVFSIILTAPLGMVIIATLGPKWLQKDQKNAIVSNVEPGDDIVKKVELVRRNSIETAARRTSEERRVSSVDGGSPFSERVADFWRDDGASSRRDQREGSVISEADSQTGLKGASASEKLVYHLATLRDFATDSANLEPEDMKLIQDASDEIEAIMREHLPRVRSVDTPGLFFRRTSATYADLDLPAPEEFIEADVEVTDPRVNSDEAV